tara:strand:- start:93 stop:461 length:369 start_codon:yes stop_codon:yes gene_type:complete
MKLIKYILFIIILIISAVFIMQLDAMNILSDGSKIMVKIPYLTNAVGFDNGLLAWQAIILSLSIGVFIGFIIALIQIISQKAEIISLKSNLRKINDELDSLRNKSLDDDIELVDDETIDDEI